MKFKIQLLNIQLFKQMFGGIKIGRKLYFILIITVIWSCQNSKKDELLNHQLPGDSLINEVILTVVKLDSFTGKNRSVYCAKLLCPYTRYYSSVGNDSIPPPPPPSGYINPIAPSDFLDFFKSRLKLNLPEKDSVFFAKEIDSLKNRQLNSSLFRNFSFIDLNYKSEKDYMRFDSIIVFYIPIFTADKKFVFVRYNYRGCGSGSILKNENGKWIRLKDFNIWNRD